MHSGNASPLPGGLLFPRKSTRGNRAFWDCSDFGGGRFRIPLLLPQHDPEKIMGFVVSRFDSGRGLEMFPRLRALPVAEQLHAQVDMDFGVLGV